MLSEKLKKHLKVYNRFYHGCRIAGILRKEACCEVVPL